MLALARVTGRSAQEELEAYQRSQAMTIALEMADRITNNPKQAAFVRRGVTAPVGPAEDCAALPDPDRPRRPRQVRVAQPAARCRHHRVRQGHRLAIAARGCVINTAPNVYTVAVAWQGLVPTAAGR
jgi:Tfp pilus assembly protein PilV